MAPTRFQAPTEKIAVSTHRLEALGDGLYAIVMTLMVLELKIPEWEGEVTNERVWHYLVELAPSIFAFALSFIILGIFWFAHRLVHLFIGNSNRGLMWLSMLFYLSISLIPFSAAMLGRYPGNQLVEVIYGVNMVAACQFIYWLWRYGNSVPGLLVREVPHELQREIRALFLFAPAIYVVAIGISFIDPTWSFFAYLLTPFLYLVPTRLDKFLPQHKRRSSSGR
ncbi:MAG: DUF1211 domain-containing protein [Flavobacteriales bacterium]|nr:DUF1211 domain-containing protein [Flavobacteriales bacterium]